MEREKVIGGLQLLKVPFRKDQQVMEILDGAIELLREYELYKAWRDYDYIGWKLKKREKKWNECQLT